ncbi:MAG: 4-hydroxy-3-methylbut-2-enyl diphosphate reductase [Candidatus Omnitrophica bacterium]|nr:4-hydroxy-3-methylbut-2-enyl diphosphate reductase [Candidatus Omnitrophota bacterium]
MEINLAKSAGFCFGVKRAIDMALKIASGKQKVYMLGDIVHNEEVVKQIRRAGIKKINKLSSGDGRTLIIRAHGTSSDTLKKALRLGYKIVDATCPMVKEIHGIARDAENKGYTVIVIGDRKHDEVLGIIGQLKNKAITIETIEDIPWKKIKQIKKASVVVQSTQNLRKVLEIIEALKPHLEELKFFNTICRPTRLKQEEIRRLPQENDVMVIIGSKTSANTKRLYEISRSLNKHSFWIQSAKEIRTGWFKGAKKVGITAGASTPHSTTQDVIRHIRAIRT